MTKQQALRWVNEINTVFGLYVYAVEFQLPDSEKWGVYVAGAVTATRLHSAVDADEFIDELYGLYLQAGIA